jgi:hypothetical protein
LLQPEAGQRLYIPASPAEAGEGVYGGYSNDRRFEKSSTQSLWLNALDLCRYWACSEVGLEGWQLMPRLVAPAVLCIWHAADRRATFTSEWATNSMRQ